MTGLRSEAVNSNDYLLDEFERFPFPVKLPGTSPKRLKDLSTDILEFVDFNAEFYWAKNIILRNVENINRFIELANMFSVNVLNGNYGEAGEILDKIEIHFGYSVWLIKNKIAFLQLTKGLEEQKKYVQNLKIDLRRGSLTKFLVHWFSIRNETQISVGRFRGQINSILDKLHPIRQQGYKEYLGYHLLNEGLSEPDAMIQSLRISFSDCIVDYYLVFIELLTSIVLSGDAKIVGKAQSVVLGLDDRIRDPKLTLLTSILNPSSIGVAENGQLVEIYDSLLKGHYDNLWETTENELAEGNHIALNLLLQSWLAGLGDSQYKQVGGRETLKAKIVNSLSEILKRGTIDASKEYNELNKIALNFSDFCWSSCIKIAFKKEHSTNLKDSENGFRNAMDCENIHPLLMDCIESNSLMQVYLSLCEKKFPTALSTQYHKHLINLVPANPLNSLSTSYSNYLNALSEFHAGNFELAKKYSDLLCTESNGYFVRRGYNLKSFSYVKQNDWKSACVCVADCYLKEKNFYPFLPLEEIIKSVVPGSNNWNEVNSLIELSIVFDAYYKHINKSIEAIRRFAYEDFLINMNLDRPSRLRPYIENLEREKVIYYLRFICLESTMDTSSSFSAGSKEVLNERLEVCRLLSDIDPPNQEHYKQEINEIVRRQIIADRRQEVDQSRIYVDVKSIKEWAENELEEHFDRYTTYLRVGLGRQDRDAVKQISVTSAMETPDDEVFALLQFMVNEIRKSYLSADIGLDRFISTRIRHGELERTMRIPIQNHNLITKKVAKNGPYKSNEYWLSKVSATEHYEVLDQSFKWFSESYDNLITKIANEWLQIKRDDKPKGLFDFTLSDKDIQRIAASILPTTTLQDFIELIIKVLDGTLIVLLVKIRETLNKNGKSEGKLLITKLQDRIFTKHNVPLFELQRAIGQARTDLSAQFDKIIEWFVPSSEGSSTPYYIDDAIHVAEAIIKEATPNFTVDMPPESDDAFPIHGQLPIFIDIFINIFENVVKRSGLEIPKAEVEIDYLTVSKEIFRIDIKISNLLGENIEILQLDTSLSRIRGLLNEGKYSEFLASEGNSGLLKIHKSINDFSVLDSTVFPKMDFYINENCFEVYLSIPFNLFVMEQEEAIEMV